MCMLVNRDGMQSVLNECRELGIPRLIYASTIGVIFSDEELAFVVESAPPVKEVSMGSTGGEC